MRISRTCNGNICGGTYSTAKCGLIYIHIYYICTKAWRMAGHQQTADTPACGGWRTGGRADTPAGGGQGGAMLRMGMNACALGEGRTRREPQRGGRGVASMVSPVGGPHSLRGVGRGRRRWPRAVAARKKCASAAYVGSKARRRQGGKWRRQQPSPCCSFHWGKHAPRKKHL
jgi:hypothetical protein